MVGSIPNTNNNRNSSVRNLLVVALRIIGKTRRQDTKIPFPPREDTALSPWAFLQADQECTTPLLSLYGLIRGII